jgi:hypothetical protein
MLIDGEHLTYLRNKMKKSALMALLAGPTGAIHIVIPIGILNVNYSNNYVRMMSE